MFDKISDLVKFGIMLVIYTGYMTWWASGVTFKIDNTDDRLGTHIVADNIITRDTITLSQTVKALQEQQKTNTQLLVSTIETHAKCTAIMNVVLQRLEKLENK